MNVTRIGQFFWRWTLGCPAVYISVLIFKQSIHKAEKAKVKTYSPIPYYSIHKKKVTQLFIYIRLYWIEGVLDAGFVLPLALNTYRRFT
jgi:hypothetical protein